MNGFFDESQIFSHDLSIWDSFTLEYDTKYITQPLDFFTAASLGETDIVKNCLDRKEVKVNDKNSSGWTALQYAAYMGHHDTVATLVAMGADTGVKTPRGYNPLTLASMCGNDPVIKLLAKYKADIESVDNHGWTALFHAASAGHQQATTLLLQFGANVLIKEPSQGLTPLMEAAASGHELVVKQLLKNGSNPAIKDKQGDDAISLAMEYGHVQIAQIIENAKKSNLTSNYKSDQKCNSSGGPSILAGPKAFAQMTGLGSDGRPHVNNNNNVPVFLQDNPQTNTEFVQQQQAKWNGPKNLEALLKQIDCVKYLSFFDKQGIDLQVFLTLTEPELKEVGITLFGPRRKMMSAITRSVSEIRNVIVTSNSPELSYANAVNSKLAKLQERIKEMEEERSELKQMYGQERQLRKVTEGLLMEHKQLISKVCGCCDKLQQGCHHLANIIDDLTAQSFTKHFEKMHLGNQNYRFIPPTKDQNSATVNSATLRELGMLSKNTNDQLRELRSICDKSKSQVNIKNENNHQNPISSSKRS